MGEGGDVEVEALDGYSRNNKKQMLAFTQIIRAELSKNDLKILSIFRFHNLTFD